MVLKSQNLSVVNYSDFRKYLKDYYLEMKRNTKHFSFRYFSKMAGFSSPNFLKLVMDGERNLSADGVNRFAKALKLDAKETRHFRLLVLMNQAASTEERDYFTRQMLKSKSYRDSHPLGEAVYDYYSKWFHIPLRELVARPDFKNDPEWIARQFTPNLSEREVREGLETLKRLGLIQEVENNGLCQVNRSVTTGDEVSGSSVANYHREMMRLASESIDRFAAEQRDVSSLTIGLTHETFLKIKKMVQDFRKEIIAVANQDEKVEEIIQFNFQLFPIVQKKDEV